MGGTIMYNQSSSLSLHQPIKSILTNVNTVVLLNPESHVLFAHSILEIRFSFSFVCLSVCYDHATPLPNLNLEILSMECFLSQTRIKPGAALQTPLRFIDSLSDPFFPKSVWRRHA